MWYLSFHKLEIGNLYDHILFFLPYKNYKVI